ncbi:MAG TPA: DEAD/DEAH box helicase [Candidatus Nitrosocosmicus sp.]|nr:DEAD/DEAH box helicase [Candidatus Nitrosocosmicus sp.]
MPLAPPGLTAGSRPFGFHPVIEAWFQARFQEPTPVQARAWPLIAAGRDVLLTAPTGSGKTLAAFLACLDRLFRRAVEGRLEARTDILYVSPLKALSNDVRRNLDEPLGELAAAAAAAGLPAPEIRTALRTGDTSAHERRQAGRRPPHIMVTTPESLFILLTAESSRRWLADVRTVIVDEIHAVAGDKRGAHLALSLERLETLVAEASGGAARLQRIGLSATVRPVETAARLLVGAARPLPEIVDVGQRRDMDLAIEVLRDELGAVCTNEQWEEIYDRVADLARAHRSTLVFVNTRRLVERVTRHLAERLGAERVAAHHSSLSRARRFEAEQRLKSGELHLVVATASLELGIDVGTVDLTCLLGSPRSIATALQRVGRSGHALLATPKGRMFPLTRDQLVECAALSRAARRAEIDHLSLRRAPLDVLAQQLVAICADGEQDEDALFALVRRAASYAELERKDFDAVVDMLAEGTATRRGRVGARLHRDAVGRRLRGRRGARLAALTSGGAIPDTANYQVVLEPDETPIGTLDEDFAIESMAGDVILLGNSSWRIRRVESGKVRVEDAGGAPSTVPFWLGEGPARTRELSAEVAAVREAVAARLDDAGAAVRWLTEETALDPRGALLVRDYVAAARAALGAVPSQTTVVVERFFDEAGGMQLVIHAPFGGRINRAWGMALRKRLCQSFNFELQAAATDDGVLLSLGPQHSFPLESVFEMLHPRGLEELLTQAALQAPMFMTRWRWNASRALALLRWQGGKRVPPFIQRMRAEDLLVAVFPAQLACQDNAEPGPVEIPDHPLVKETLRDCLGEAMDVDGLRACLEAIHAGRIRRVSRDTPEPSVFAHEILNANPYAFLDDAPLEERRARAVTLRRGLPAAVADDYGRLDPAAIAAVVEEAQPDLRSADELHDLLLELGALPEASAAPWAGYLEELIAARRAARLRGDDRVFWVAAERRSLAAAVWPAFRFEPEVVEPPARRAAAWSDPEGALVEVVRARLGVVGPTTAAALAEDLAVSPGQVDAALAAVEAEGGVLRGRFTPAAAERDTVEWCDRRLLARIHRRTLDGLRRLIEPVSAAALIRFLLSWQHVRPGTQQHGRDGLLRVIERLEGFEAAAGAWERELLPMRAARYDPGALDELCLAGETVWGRLGVHPSSRHAGRRLSATVPVALFLRRDLPWLLEPRDGEPSVEPSGPAQDVLAHLRRAGASFVEDIAAGVRRMRLEVEEALCELVTAGLVTGDGFAGLRGLMQTEKRRRQRPGRAAVLARRAMGTGRWAVLAPAVTPAEDDVTEAKARLYVRRYGVVFRDLLPREPGAPAWRDLLRVYRRLEMRGELRGGRIVGGFVGEQFAAPEALEALRAIRREPADGQVVRVSACDPLNLVGILTPGPRVPAVLGHHVHYRDGVPLTEASPEGDRDGTGRRPGRAPGRAAARRSR